MHYFTWKLDLVAHILWMIVSPKEIFFSKLNNKAISDNDYKHAQRVWNKFNNENIGEYWEMYNMQDV